MKNGPESRATGPVAAARTGVIAYARAPEMVIPALAGMTLPRQGGPMPL